MPAFKDITGQRFGRLVAVSRYGINRSRAITWLCKCDCGREHIVNGKALKSGRSRSCGCLPTNPKQHGWVNTTIYNSWRGMIKRCYQTTDKDYKNYGARGITVCDRWKSSFADFLKDMGPRPKGRTLDRINLNGNYELSNCRWATFKQQANNRRNGRYPIPRLFVLRRSGMWYLWHANDNPT